MPALLLVSPHSLAGKTTIAVGLAQKLRAAGHSVSFARLPGDDNAEHDGQVFEALGRSPQSSQEAAVSVIEAPSGDPGPPLEANRSARAIVIGLGRRSETDLVDYCRGIGDRLAGVVLNKTPAKCGAPGKAALDAAGVKVHAVVTEDRLLAAPVLHDVATALSASVEYLNDGGFQPLDRPLIATISADPGQGYFAGYGAKAVIVRSDKPDLQLAALNAGATCLVVTGGLPLLSYVIERAEEDEIPLVRTSMDTISTVNSIEGLFGTLPFAANEAKIRRAAELLADIDTQSLLV
jgi:BioD-like phosphotransacetylase family protein